MRVAVVGGGITGLVAARRLAEARPAEVVVLEASERLGGKLRSARLAGCLVEEGPDSFVDREPLPRRLCEELGLGEDLVAPAVFGAYVWSRGKLRPLPKSLVSGVPSSPLSALRCGLLSPRGVARAAGDLVLPGPLTGPDVSIGALIRRRLGNEVLERLVDPLLAGTRAGRADDMSLEAAAPAIDEVARAHRSLVLGSRAAFPGGAGPPPFLGLKGGMQQLAERLSADLVDKGVSVHTRWSLERIERAGAHDGYILAARDGRTLAAEGIVLALPAFAAAAALEGIAPPASELLSQTEYASVGIASLLYPPSDWRAPPHSSGILVPSVECRSLAGCTWTSVKWPHLRPPGGGHLVRAFVGRAGRDPVLELPDEDIVERIRAELDDMAGLNSRPHHWMVTRWERAIPQYAVGHNGRLDAIEDALSAHGGLVLAGAGYRGSGLPDCIRQGDEAARRVLEALPVPSPGGTVRARAQGGRDA